MKIKNKNLYYVGGVVRDEILGLQSFDIDLCYEGNAIEFAQELNIIKTNPDFGTVRVLIEEDEIDIASTRTETYPRPGHLPIVDKIGCPLEEDLRRRDFTVNALAKNTISGEIIDYFGGLNDLKDKKLKVLHDKSFIEDPSRIIRGLKFSIRFGFELDEHTKKLQNEYLENINYDMSYHRIKKELKEAFNLNNENLYNQFIKQGIFKLIGKNVSIPEFSSNYICKLNEEFKPTYPYMVFLGLFNLSNFELTKDEQAIIDSYNKIKSIIPNNDYENYKLFKNLPLESIIMYASTVDYNVATRFLRELAEIKLEINGNDLEKIGIKQGEIYKEIFDAVLKEKFINKNMTKDDEINFVKKNIILK